MRRRCFASLVREQGVQIGFGGRPSPVNFDHWFDSLFRDWPRPTFAASVPRVEVREEADGYHGGRVTGSHRV